MHTRLTSNAPHSSGKRAASSAPNLRSSKRGVVSTVEEERDAMLRTQRARRNVADVPLVDHGRRG